MRLRVVAAIAGATLLGAVGARAADSASGTVVVQKEGTIAPKFAAGYIVRDERNARTTQTEVLLADAAVDPADLQGALDPHTVAINLDALKSRNYVLLFVRSDGRVAMNATFSKTMTQFLNDTDGGLKVDFTTRTPARIEGHVFSPEPLRTIDGTTYTVDLTFGVDVSAPPVGTPLPRGGGDPGKALTAFLAVAGKKNWAGLKAGASPAALKMFDKSYNTSEENAADAADMLQAWIPLRKMTITGGQRRDNVAVLDVEGELFPGQIGLSVVQMVKAASGWQFDRAARAGLVR
jgi:hypothetical protein